MPQNGRMNSRVANFAGVRLLAALSVLAGHALDSYEIVGTRIAHVGLLTLFSVSGYLVAGSWRSDPHISRFLMRRFLRIWPAYAVMIVLCAILVYPMQPHVAMAFLRNLWFEFHPVGINGSIWMIAIEVSLYVLLALAGAATLGSLAALCLFTIFMTWYFGPGWVDFGVFFVYGLLLQAYPEIRRRAALALVVLAGMLALLLGSAELGTLLVVPAATVWVGTRSWPVLRSAARWGDLSYGVVLWHGPVIYFLVRPSGQPLASGLIVTTVLSLTLALISWHTIERGALQWKPARVTLAVQ